MSDTTKTTRQVKAKVESFDIASSQDTMSLANDLSKFIKENKLTTNTQGKEHVQVEAWQYAGSRLGLVPLVKFCRNISDQGELKYEAHVEILNLRTGQIVGSGFSCCSNKEPGKKFNQEFAISSMAQTRATGKAFRLLIAWLIRAAGYEPTPSEEMDFSGNAAPETKGIAAAAQVKQQLALPATPAAAQHPGTAIADNEAEQPAVAYATAAQKEEIIRLLNHPVITRQEKTKMLLNINRLDEERATAAVAKLREAIEDRQNGESAAA